jgi:hypothetical protein
MLGPINNKLADEKEKTQLKPTPYPRGGGYPLLVLQVL